MKNRTSNSLVVNRTRKKKALVSIREVKLLALRLITVLAHFSLYAGEEKENQGLIDSCEEEMKPNG